MSQVMDGGNAASSNGQVLPNGQLETVADRLAKLERTLATLQDPNQLEQRVTEKLLAKMSEHSPAGLVPMLPGSAASSVAQGLMTAAASAAVDSKFGKGSFWEAFSILKELQLVFRMYFDPRYRLSRIAQLGVPIIFVMMILNYLNFTQVWTLPIVAPILERGIFIVLAFAMYKILAREAQRYSDVLKYLAQFGQ
jgi:hypothetical protein